MKSSQSNSSLDAVGMWLAVGDYSSGPADQAGGDLRVCSNYKRITLLSLAKSNPGSWREEFGCWSKQQFRRNSGVFVTIMEHRISSVLTKCLRVHGSFAHSGSICFVDLEKAVNLIPHCVLWQVLWEYGGLGPLLRGRLATRVGAWFVLATVCPTSQCMLDSNRCVLSLVLFIIFMDRISRRNQGPEGVQFWNRGI